MPKLPTKYFYAISAGILILFGILALFFLYQQGGFSKKDNNEIKTFPGATPENKNPESSYKKNGFYGTVTSVDPDKRELDVKNTEDGAIYSLKLNSKGVVTKSGKTSSFDQIKTGDKVNFYSENAETLDEERTISIDLINISVRPDSLP